MDAEPKQKMTKAEAGRLGGSRKTRKKKRSSRENGKLGGRPIKPKEQPPTTQPPIGEPS